MNTATVARCTSRSHACVPGSSVGSNACVIDDAGMESRDSSMVFTAVADNPSIFVLILIRRRVLETLVTLTVNKGSVSGFNR